MPGQRAVSERWILLSKIYDTDVKAFMTITVCVSPYNQEMRNRLAGMILAVQAAASASTADNLFPLGRSVHRLSLTDVVADHVSAAAFPQRFAAIAPAEAAISRTFRASRASRSGHSTVPRTPRFR